MSPSVNLQAPDFCSNLRFQKHFTAFSQRRTAQGCSEVLRASSHVFGKAISEVTVPLRDWHVAETPAKSRTELYIKNIDIGSNKTTCRSSIQKVDNGAF